MMRSKNAARVIRLILFAAVFTAGFVAGSLVQRNDSIRNVIADYASDVVSLRIDGDALTVFIESAVSYLSVLLALILFGNGRLGTFLNCIVILWMGMGKGALLSSLAGDSGSHGILFSVLVLLPGMIAAVCAVLMFASRTRSCSDSHRQNIRSFGRNAAAVLMYFFVLIFSAGLDVTFAEIYKAISTA